MAESLRRSDLFYASGLAFRPDAALELKTTHTGEGDTNFVYDTRGRLSTKTYPNGASTELVYIDTPPSGSADARSLVWKVKHHAGSNTEEYAYTYDNAGRIMGIVNGSYTSAYTYDHMCFGI